MHRRTLLRFSGLWPVVGAGSARAAPFAGPVASEPLQRTLAAYLDTLIPADASPSASQLGLHHRFLELGRRSSAFRRLLETGCDWLDKEAIRLGAGEFARLTEPKREALVAKAAGLGRRSGARRFFEATRDSAMRHYYSRPEAWPSLGYAGPPQPLGFPDYAKPMKAG